MHTIKYSVCVLNTDGEICVSAENAKINEHVVTTGVFYSNGYY